MSRRIAPLLTSQVVLKKSLELSTCFQMRMSCLPVGRFRRSEGGVGVPDDAAVAAGVEGPHDPDAGHDLDH